MHNNRQQQEAKSPLQIPPQELLGWRRSRLLWVAVVLFSVASPLYASWRWTDGYTEADEDVCTECITDSLLRKQVQELRRQIEINEFKKKSMSESAVGKGRTIHFSLQPNAFVETVGACLKDRQCYFYYQHVGKTGGSTIEEHWRVLAGHRYPKPSCCDDQIMEDFAAQPSSYCNRKFAAFQVNTERFMHALRTCLSLPLPPPKMNATSPSLAGPQQLDNDIKNENTAAPHRPRRRAVVLVSYREPISRAVSHVHQQCNKKFSSRSEIVKKACVACQDYPGEDDVIHETNETKREELAAIRKVWTDLMFDSNELYKGLVELLTIPISNLTGDPADTDNDDLVTFLGMDMLDLNDMFRSLKEGLPEYRHVAIDKSKNLEKKYRCNFGMRSDLIKLLRPSAAVYRNLTAGFV